MTVKVTLDADEVMQMLSGFSENLQEQVCQMAVNKTLAKAKTEMKRQILEMYNLKSTEVGAALNISKVTRKKNKYTGELYPSTLGGKGRAMNVIRFLQGTGKGELLFQFLRAGAIKTIKPVDGKSAPFIGNAGRTVFRRTGTSRLPIESVQVIDVPQMFNSKKINQAVLDKARDDLISEANTALNYMLSKMKATLNG